MTLTNNLRHFNHFRQTYSLGKKGQYLTNACTTTYDYFFLQLNFYLLRLM